MACIEASQLWLDFRMLHDCVEFHGGRVLMK